MLLLYTLVAFSLPITMVSQSSPDGNFTSATAIATGNIAKKGCETHCGNVTVFYPFGIGLGEGCSLEESFDLNCSSTENPPKLFYGSGNIEVYNISDFEVRVSNAVALNCYDQDGYLDQAKAAWTDVSDTPFTLSRKNKFTVIGCDDFANITGTDFSSGCWGTCREVDEVPGGYCSGIGCCQTSIPKGLKDYNVDLFSFDSHIRVQSFNPCGMAFLGEEDSFKFRGAPDLLNFTEFYERTLSVVPIVLDWVIGSNRSCREATECKGNSTCKDAENGGYHCICDKGYEGNPYLDPGCQDIDECKNKSKCYGNCINTQGSYNCTCWPGYTGDATKTHGCRYVSKESKNSAVVLILGAVLGIMVLIFSLWLVKVLRRRKHKKLKEKFFKRNGGLLLQQQMSSGEGMVDHQTRLFKATELEKATGQFNEDRIIGRGGQGTVYKGMLADGRIVAVKKSMLVDENQVETFINEVFILSQIIHKNVVKLLGCCLETEVPMLVYEFVSNGTLFDFIHDENYEFPTLWKLRLQIATEIAGALAYLHSATFAPIYHRDIKSSNILLDDKFRAKVSDFGISKSFSGEQTHLSTLVKGTMGYLDPEYFQSSHLTEKSDVYSFGVVLLELLTGKNPIFRTPYGERMSLITFVLSMEDEQLVQNVDDRVSDAPKEQLIAVANLSKRCLNLNGMLRPNMKDVASELEIIRTSG